MRFAVPFLLFLLLAVPALAYMPSCVLKLRVLSPDDGFIAPSVAEGYTNLFININVTNASSRVAAAGVAASVTLDNGTSFGMAANGAGNYSVNIADYREGTHSYTINANLSGCVNDTITQTYYYQKGLVRSAPDFNPAFAPLVAIALIFVARQQKRKARK
jgi:hypothetical protein